MQSFFDPVVDQILRLIEKQLDPCPGKRCNKLFLIGGFSASPYLRKAISDKFSERFDNVILPMDPGAAIVQGAVLYGLNPDSIQARRSRYSYGMKLCASEAEYGRKSRKASNHSDIFINQETNESMVTMVHPVMIANQLVDIDDFYSTKCFPLYSYQLGVNIEISATAATIDRETSYSDVRGNFVLGTQMVEGIPRSGDRSITTYFYFGLTELTVIAKVNATGAEKRQIVNFTAR
ncbi:hypothetical protein SpCBS45565_g05826 [Spizellomyces sp. 'palustris']|nr:hypothetical protein SpCBS45565_g05826 [Spizellomyces sp. 'palustris']